MKKKLQLLNQESNGKNINTVVTRQNDKYYTKNGVIISNTKNIKIIITKGKGKNIKQEKTNTCFKVKNVGCSGLSNLFLD